MVARIVQVGAPGGCGIPAEAAAIANSPLSWNVTDGAAFHQSTASDAAKTHAQTMIHSRRMAIGMSTGLFPRLRVREFIGQHEFMRLAKPRQAARIGRPSGLLPGRRPRR